MPDPNDTPIGRYARILEALAQAPEGLNLTQIATATNLQMAAAHRLMSSLTSVGFAERLGKKKAFVLGPLVHRLFHLGVAPRSVILVAEPILHDLVAQFGETAFLAKLTAGHVESVAMEMPEERNRAFVQPGRIMPMHAAASAKAILAFQDEVLISRVLAEPRSAFTPDTKIQEADIRAELDDIRQDGFAICDNELDPGVLNYAVPVFIGDNQVHYSIGISGLPERLRVYDQSDLRAALQKAAHTLSQALKS